MNTPSSFLSRENWVSEKEMHSSFFIQKPQHDCYQMFKECAGSQASAALNLRIWLFFRLSGVIVISGRFERTFRLFLQGLRISS